jgi:hypothetical protein
MKNHTPHCTLATRFQRVLSTTTCVLLAGAFAASAQAETLVFNTSGSFVAPDGVTSVTVEAWGGGGGGGSHSGASSSGGAAGGGGGGGGFSKRVVVPVTPGQIYSFTVGSGGAGGIPNGLAGGDSSFVGDGGVTVLARGGAGGSAATGGNGGALGTGDTGMRFAGGKGGNCSTNAGGGGGGAAQLAAAGTAGSAGSGVTGGNGGSLGGGKGGNKDDAGQHGSSPGAGGGGNGRDGAAPGNGVAGRLVIAYTAQVDAVQTGMALDASAGMIGGGMLYRPMPGVMNDDGSYSFQAYAMIGTGDVVAANDELLLTNSSGMLRVIAREGDAVAGGSYLSSGFRNVLLSPHGRTIAMSNIRDTAGVGRASGFATLISPDGVSLELIKQTGETAAAGGRVATVGANVVIDDTDRIYYVFNEVGRPATQDSRFDSEAADGSSSICLANEGQDVSAVTGDRAWLGQIGKQIAAGGTRGIFLARLQNNPADKKQRTLAAANEAVFAASAADGLSVVLRKGQAVAAADGAKIKTLHGAARSGNGRHAILASLAKPALRGNDQVLLFEDAGNLQVVARKGVTEIVPGLTLARFGQYFVTNAGAVVFNGWLAGARATDDGVLCRWTPAGGIEVIAREGAAAPSSGRNYATLSRFSVSPGGAILFQAHLTGAGINGAVYRLLGASLEKIVQTGENVLFEGAPTRVLALAIHSSSTGSGGGGGSGEAINDVGQTVIALSLGNGRHVNRVFE